MFYREQSSACMERVTQQHFTNWPFKERRRGRGGLLEERRMHEVVAHTGHCMDTWKLGDLWLLLEWVLLGGWVLLVLVLRGRTG